MKHTPPFREKALVSHLVGKGMLEGVLEIGKEGSLIEELSRLEMLQAAS
jgi:hypothetical protein